jgi:hypothetical protein
VASEFPIIVARRANDDQPQIQSHSARMWMGGVPKMSGFDWGNVGLSVGFLTLPDMHQPCGIIGLDAKCRVCRVFTGVESPGGLGAVLRVCEKACAARL